MIKLALATMCFVLSIAASIMDDGVATLILLVVGAMFFYWHRETR